MKIVDQIQLILNRLTRLERNSIRARSLRSVQMPAGTIGWTAAATAPKGALLMNGQAVSRLTYARLFAAIGTTYGAGNGSTTFNLPDARGRVLAHSAASGNLSGLGSMYGTETHTLTVSQMPSHNHGGSTGNSAVDSSSYANTGSGNRGLIAASGSSTRQQISGSSHSHSIPSQGGGAAHNNVQPTLVVNGYIWT